MTNVLHLASSSGVRLPIFIRESMSSILSEWENFARTIIPGASRLGLRDHAKEILNFIADDIETFQTRVESTQKSHGKSTQDNKLPTSAAEIHAGIRLADGFNIVQMVSEYRALRASVVRLWTAERPHITSSDLVDLTRFNEAIDQALAESIARFTEKVDQSRNLFLGILGHDIRNPLGAILMSAQLIQRGPQLGAKQNILVTQIADCSLRIAEIVDQLIDLTRMRLGTGISIKRAHMDIGILAESLIEETKARFPDRKISLKLTGDMKGDWDRARLGQVFSNLLGNAVQYSTPGSEISVSLNGDANQVLLTVHNVGVPIASDALLTIFGSLVRTSESIDAAGPGSTNLGLGLYIAREIVASHGGTITVTSSANDGTAFTVILPKT